MGAGLLLFLCFYDYHNLLNYAPWFYLIIVGLLVATLLVGSEISGARRWLQFGGFTLQASEIAKLAVILLLARFFGEFQQGEATLVDLGKVAVTVGVPAMLIAMQPDLGTSLTLVPIALITLFVAGLRLRYFGAMLLIGALALPIAVHFLKPYQKERIATFLNPEADPKNTGYQVLQSKIAVGSGQLWGKGTGEGTQTQLRFLPVPHTDFIFAAFAEEHGFVGVLFGLMLYGGRLSAGHRDSPASDELWGVFGGVYVFGDWFGKQRSHPALCELAEEPRIGTNGGSRCRRPERTNGAKS
jgi:rod shape determining protein RodA